MLTSVIACVQPRRGRDILLSLDDLVEMRHLLSDHANDCDHREAAIVDLKE